MSNKRHWTTASSADYRHAIAANFVSQIENWLDKFKWSQATFAQKLGVTEGRVSQILSNPGNITLNSIVQWSQVVQLSVSIVAYDDNVLEGSRGPINPEVFRRCWEILGKPDSLMELDEKFKKSVRQRSQALRYRI
jgi:transcriptional regulator with XRE-family HTH domain